MTPEEKVTAAGLADVEPITAEEWQALPEHKRDMRSVFVRLPDPPLAVAMRRIFDLLDRAPDLSPDAREAWGVADEALGDFDGTTS